MFLNLSKNVIALVILCKYDSITCSMGLSSTLRNALYVNLSNEGDQVGSLGQEDLLEKGMATAIFLPGEFHEQRRLVGCIVHGVKKTQTRLSD